MAYYHDGGAAEEKVRSLFVDVEVIGGRLWCVAALELTGPLTTEEMANIKEYLTGQYSDGFGEGFEQRYVEVNGGELNVHLWKSSDQFFIATRQEFEARTGIEPPAAEQPAPVAESPDQASFHEPDIYGDETATALRTRLLQRLDANLADYFAREVNSEGNSIANMSGEIAAYSGAHYYLSEIHNFHISELEYLLKFQNPLSVVADQFELEAEIEDHSAVMRDIFDTREALKHYERVREEPSPETLAPEARLRARLKENLAEYKDNMLSRGKEELFNCANEVASTLQSYAYLAYEHRFTASEADFLLKFEDPLNVVSDRCDDLRLDVAEIVDVIFRDKAWTLRQGGYALMQEDEEPAAAEPLSRHSIEKPSVMEQIRRAREDAKQNPAPQREIPGKDRGQEL